MTTADEDVHAFAWSADSKTLYFVTRTPWTKAQQEAHKKEWKDVIQYRGDERGDTIFSIQMADALTRRAEVGKTPSEDNDSEGSTTPGSKVVARTPGAYNRLQHPPMAAVSPL